MRILIKETLTKKQKKSRPELFLEKDFKDKAAAEDYAKEHCGSWIKITIKEV